MISWQACGINISQPDAAAAELLIARRCQAVLSRQLMYSMVPSGDRFLVASLPTNSVKIRYL